VFGSIFNAELSNQLAVRAPGASAHLTGHSLSVQAVRALPEPIRAGVINSFAEALTHVFLYAVPFVVLAFVMSWLLRDEPLRTAVAPAQASDPEFVEVVPG